VTKQIITSKIRDNIHKRVGPITPSKFRYLYLTEFGSAWISSLRRHHNILKSRLTEELTLDNKNT